MYSNYNPFLTNWRDFVNKIFVYNIKKYYKQLNYMK